MMIMASTAAAAAAKQRPLGAVEFVEKRANVKNELQ